MRYELPYDIRVVVTEPIFDRSRDLASNAGTVVSNLVNNLGHPDSSPDALQRVQGRAEALECFLLALACAGVNIGSREFVRALDGTVRILGQTVDANERGGTAGHAHAR